MPEPLSLMFDSKIKQGGRALPRKRSSPWRGPFFAMTESMQIEDTQEGVPTSAPSSRPRVQVDFSNEAYKRLQEIKAVSGDKTNVDVIRNAIRLYGWYLDKKADDYQFLLSKNDDVRQIELIL